MVRNRAADPTAPWTPEQDAILSDEGFARAAGTIRSWRGFSPTRLVSLPHLAVKAGVASLHYKDEAARFGLGSFKALGGAYAVARLLAREASDRLGRPVGLDGIASNAVPGTVRDITVTCATDGNHGRSVAWGAQRFGCRCVIFIHATVSEGRRHAIESYGAQVRRTAGNYDDSVREAEETARAEGWFVVSDTSYPGYTDVPRDVMQGYELMAAEAFDALDRPPTHVFLQTGVGGMAAAVAAQAKRRYGSERPIIVLADPVDAACWVESFAVGRPTVVDGDLPTVMAGLACGEVSLLAWTILRDHADAVVAVPDGVALDAMRRLANPPGGTPPIVAGESATAGLAALLMLADDGTARAELGLDTESRALVFGTEGDTDPELYREIVGRDAEAVRRTAA